MSGFAAWSTSTSVERVLIKHAKISNEAVKSIGKLKRVTKVDLMYTPVSDAVLEYLKDMKTVREVRLYGTDVDARGGRTVPGGGDQCAGRIQDGCVSGSPVPGSALSLPGCRGGGRQRGGQRRDRGPGHRGPLRRATGREFR